MEARILRLYAVASAVLFGSTAGVSVLGGQSSMALANAAVKDSRLTILGSNYNGIPPIPLAAFGIISDLDADKFSGAILTSGTAVDATITGSQSTGYGYRMQQVSCPGGPSQEYGAISITLSVPPDVSKLVIRYQFATAEGPGATCIPLGNHDNLLVFIHRASVYCIFYQHALAFYDFFNNFHAIISNNYIHWNCAPTHYIFDQHAFKYHFFAFYNTFKNSPYTHKGHRVCGAIYCFVVVFRN
ncbi:hypothetical protein EsH8_X_000028 [Colletotrichum jinshuiense]